MPDRMLLTQHLALPLEGCFPLRRKSRKAVGCCPRGAEGLEVACLDHFSPSHREVAQSPVSSTTFASCEGKKRMQVVIKAPSHSQKGGGHF